MAALHFAPNHFNRFCLPAIANIASARHVTRSRTVQPNVSCKQLRTSKRKLDLPMIFSWRSYTCRILRDLIPGCPRRNYFLAVPSGRLSFRLCVSIRVRGRLTLTFFVDVNNNKPNTTTVTPALAYFLRCILVNGHTYVTLVYHPRSLKFSAQRHSRARIQYASLPVIRQRAINDF
jgi:hypothetical protein